jgi:hypothetical protein
MHEGRIEWGMIHENSVPISIVSAGKVTEMWCGCLDTAVDRISETSDSGGLTATDLVHETRALFQKLIHNQLVTDVPLLVPKSVLPCKEPTT